MHSTSAALVPKDVTGSKYDGLMHGADWFATLTRVAGVAVPPAVAAKLDGHDQWDAITAGAASPRTEVLYGRHDDAPDHSTPFDDAIRDAEGWKLIYGWGGKPSDVTPLVNATAPTYELAPGTTSACTARNCPGWPFETTAAPAVCNLALLEKKCLPGNDLAKFTVDSVATCCAACEGNASTCAAFTLNANICYLKKKAGTPEDGATCTSAVRTRAPTPAPPPSPRPTLLFNVSLNSADVAEEHDLTAAFPSVVARLSARLDAYLATAVEVPGGGDVPDPACPFPASGWPKNSNGSYISPWC